jgi:hypothetical protein
MRLSYIPEEIERPILSVIIPCNSTRHQIINLLKSIDINALQSHIEILIVDDHYDAIIYDSIREFMETYPDTVFYFNSNSDDAEKNPN